MSIGDRFAAASNRFFLRIRHPEAFRAAAQEGTRSDLDAFVKRKYALLTTFRRDGTPVPTPVWFGVADGKLYVRSESDIGKVKRIRANGRARVAPCDSRGKPLGPTTEATARVLPTAEEPLAERALSANYGLFRKLYERGGGALGVNTVYLEVTPGSPAS